MKKMNEIEKSSEQLIKSLATLSEAQLSELIYVHNRKYFYENSPSITDEAFDKLVEALKLLNPKAEALVAIGHNERAFGNEITHQRPMLSLEKCYDDASFFKWAEKINGDFLAMPKIDGVACSVIYSTQGELLQTATRGDGRVGENITKNALLIPDLPAKLPKEIVSSIAASDENLEIRGEIFLPISKFKEQFAKEFVSPRNLAAGVIKLKESDQSKNQALRFFPYDLRGSILTTEREKFELLERLNFSMMPWRIVHNDESATEIYFEWLKLRDTFDFEIDGVVFRANLLNDQRRLGETAHHPRYAMAYKFQGESAQTKLVGVEWSVSRTGSVTPVAIVEPVFVSGASITRASLHNLGIFLSLELAEESLVEIVRRGGVIPHLERVLFKKGAPLSIPEHCPSCGGALVVDGDFLRCAQPDSCEEVVVAKLIHFVHVFGIEGLGEKIIRKLFQAGLVKKFGDVFRITASDLHGLERMGEVLASKLLEEIHKKRTIDLPTFLRALGINEIGTNVSELLAANFHILARIRELSEEDLLAVHGIGASIARSLIDGLRELSTEIDDVLTEVSITEGETINVDADITHPLFGKSVVFTGKMAHLDRKAAQALVKSFGGKTPDAMSAAVNFLVIGDDGSPLLGAGKKSTKQKAAEKLISAGHHIEIISESDFLKMV